MQAPGMQTSLLTAPPAAAACRRRPPADEAVLLGAFRDSLQLHFGDHGLGSALASFQGALTLRAGWHAC